MYPHDNIFSIYYNIGRRTPFLVKRCESGPARSSSEERRMNPNRDRTFLVESVKPRGKYGKAYGKCFVDGKPDKRARSRRHSPRPLFPFLSVGIETSPIRALFMLQRYSFFLNQQNFSRKSCCPHSGKPLF